MKDLRATLCRRLGYEFEDPELLTQALTHRSARGCHNERLEFLGDAVLNLVAAEALYQRFSSAREGALTRMRAVLVRKETLAEVARGLDLGAFLSLGPGELKSGGRDRDSILADAMEAVIGAVYLDSDLETARSRVLVIIADRIEDLDDRAAEKDPKTQLQEWLQSRHLALPVYVVRTVDGEGHTHSFMVDCHIEDLETTTTGHGQNRRAAEQQAAERALARLPHSVRRA